MELFELGICEAREGLAKGEFSAEDIVRSVAGRVREKNGIYEMTLKTPLSHGLLEKNEALTKDQFHAFKNDGVFPKCDLVRFLTMLGFDVESLKILTFR